MTNTMIEITTAAGAAEAYVSRPDDTSHPGVLLYIDAIGLRPRIKEMADRIASWGYVVLAPNVFYREGTAAELAPATDLRDPVNRQAFFTTVMPRVEGHTSEQARADLDAYLDTLRALPGVAGTDVGITGYCMGGRLALRAAGWRPDVVAAAGIFHAGGLVTEDADSPHLGLESITAELFLGHADGDRSNPPEAIAALDRTLDDVGATYRSEVFAGAPHGYTMSDSSTYDEAGAERHFRELQALLGRTLGG